jgi:hypothetical protein
MRLMALDQVLTIALVVAALVITSIVPSLGKLIVTTLLAILRISVALPSLCIVVVLESGLLIATPILLEVLSWLERLCSWREGTGAWAEAASLLLIAVQVHLLCLPREVLLLCGRVIFPRIKIRHGCIRSCSCLLVEFFVRYRSKVVGQGIIGRFKVDGGVGLSALHITLEGEQEGEAKR